MRGRRERKSELLQEVDVKENPPGRVNHTLRNELAARRRQRALWKFLDELAAAEGALDTPQDEAEIQRLMQLLGGRST